jgi:hypothetical protein
LQKEAYLEGVNSGFIGMRDYREQMLQPRMKKKSFYTYKKEYRRQLGRTLTRKPFENQYLPVGVVVNKGKIMTNHMIANARHNSADENSQPESVSKGLKGLLGNVLTHANTLTKECARPEKFKAGGPSKLSSRIDMRLISQDEYVHPERL